MSRSRTSRQTLRRLGVVVWAMVVMAMGLAASPLADLSKEVEALVADALPSRVTVDVNDRLTDGVLLDQAGHVLLPHVLKNQSYTVHIGGEQVRAKFVASDTLGSVTVLKVDRIPDGAEVAVVATQRPRMGELAVMLPSGGGAGRLVVWHGAPRENAMADGLVLVAADGDGSDGAADGAAVAGFVCDNEFRPLDLSAFIARKILAGGKVDRPRLGALIGVTQQIIIDTTVEGDAIAMQEIKPQTSLMVLRVLPDSPAEASGLQQGDYILTFDDRPVTNLAELGGLLAAAEEHARVTALRRGKQLQFDVDLRPSPDDAKK